MFESMAGFFAREGVARTAHSALPDAPQQQERPAARDTPRRTPGHMRSKLAVTLHSLADRLAPTS